MIYMKNTGKPIVNLANCINMISVERERQVLVKKNVKKYYGHNPQPK